MASYSATLLIVFSIYTKKKMNTELQNKVWSILPKEFKEEVKRMHRIANSDVDQMIVMITLENVFGHQNLTSDAEGEETLICEKSKVQRAYNTSREIVKAENPNSLMYSMHTQIMCVLESIFGSKCLPDELNEDNFAKSEPQPAEQKEEADKQFDNILKDDFRDHNRLHIAAMAMQGLISKTSRFSSYEISNLVRISLDCADALIKKAEGGIK